MDIKYETKKATKRSRTQNWCEEEKGILKELVKDKIKIIECKTNDTKTTLLKKSVWLDIKQQLAAEGFERDVTRIKEQWARMKLSAKSNIAKYKRYQKGTGGGGPPKDVPTDGDWEIRDLIPHDFEDDQAQFDSDAIMNQVPIEEDKTEYILNSRTGELIEAEIPVDDILNVVIEEPASNSKDSVDSLQIIKKQPKILQTKRITSGSKKVHLINKTNIEENLLQERLKQINEQMINEKELQKKRLLYEENKQKKLDRDIEKEEEIHALRIICKKKKLQLLELQINKIL